MNDPQPAPRDLLPTAAESTAATVRSAAGDGTRIHRIPGRAADGADPLVAAFAARAGDTCALHILLPWWLPIGALGSLFGGLGLHAALGAPGEPPTWVETGSLVDTLHRYAGDPAAMTEGMLLGTLAAMILGRVVRPRGVPAVTEPLVGGLLLLLAYLACFDARVIAVGVIMSLLCAVYLLAIGYRLLCLLVARRAWRPSLAGVLDDRLLPVYTVLVPLYREREVAGTILARLAALDYPRDKLDVKLLLEADDPETLAVIEAARIPPWCEVVIVPDAQPKTKPRACNHGLALARGEFTVIYDAEDRPESDQLRLAVAAFRQRPAQVACLQAALAYHNHDQNLLTRWFAIEYNVWFGRYLDGLHRLGGPIPLGGTSNHFRTEALRQLGGWDPFNVTEDCDLGVRLAMAGLHTETIDSITWEEANCRVGNWLRQRSRWLKGYMATHLVWIRHPVTLVRRLGPLGALRFSLAVGGVAWLALFNLPLWILSAVYVVCLGHDLAQGGHGPWELLTQRGEDSDGRWSWPVAYLGADEHPVLSTLSLVFALASAALLAANLLFVVVNLVWGSRAGQRGLWWAALLSPLYWVLISLAALRAFRQLLFQPHRWEKTLHGLDTPH